ncbi:MAG: TonB-dependent receptor [Verrucomicrobia bacterium]|nr:TonB-dependent receptor [Verrucomicrobiota bacterium]
MKTVDGDDVFAVVENMGTFGYDNILPNLQFRYEIDGQTILRAAFTGTVGRPQYEKASPISVLEYEELPPDDVISPGFENIGELEIGNPELSPYEAINFDLAIEHYLQSGGVVSAGVFWKDIDNPIYEFEDQQDNVTYNGIGFDSLSTTSFQNAPSATIKGVELAAQIPFTTFFEDSFFDGFGLDVNATFISSDVTIFDREMDNLPFFRQPSEIYNVAFYYQKHGFAARIAWNYQDESLRRLSGNSDFDRWDDTREFTDIQASYNINDNYTLYINWQNIFDEEKIQTYGRSTNRLRSGEFYGSYVRAGVRFNWR